jgi:hypothetical protein
MSLHRSEELACDDRPCSMGFFLKKNKELALQDIMDLRLFIRKC